jgi:hypothetical protein
MKKRKVVLLFLLTSLAAYISVAQCRKPNVGKYLVCNILESDEFNGVREGKDYEQLGTTFTAKSAWWMGLFITRPKQFNDDSLDRC